jgi:hypothetical protein|tara:strand:- start:360 stop:611 length:252 start_codon:yes stop_codon:yes gene_type:complete
MCFGGRQKMPDVAPPTPPPAPAPVQKLEPTKPPAATPAPEQATQEKATLKKKDTGAKKKERMRTGTASLQTAPGQGLNIGGGS